jgi:hypothetical protein
LWIFSSNKSAPANRKTVNVFYANRDPNKQEGGFIFARSGSELRLFKYSRWNLNNQKPIAVDVLFKAYPMVSLA